MSRLELRGLTKRYPGAKRDAVHNVTLRIEPGEIMGLVGGSGSGKSTLLRLIAGLETPTAGCVVLGGCTLCDDRSSTPPERRGVGLVFQDYALFPHLTIAENVAYGLHRMPRRERAARVREMLELVGLVEEANRYPHQVSGGQQQRTALARALAPDPGVLLLDEPFSNLDAVMKPALRDEVGRILRRAGTTTLIVVHDHEDVLSLADRVAILRDGELWQVGAPAELFSTPRDAYVARLFGPTNLVPAVAVNGTFRTPLGVVRGPEGLNGAAREVTLSIRPYDIEVAPAGDGGVDATVRRVAFLGGFDELELELPSGDGSAPMTVIAHLPGGGRYASGDSIRIRVRPGAVQVLTGDDAKPPSSLPSCEVCPRNPLRAPVTLQK